MTMALSWTDVLGATVGTVGMTFFAIFFGLLYKGIDRIVAARMQSRVGPPIVQPFLDVGKLMIKDTVQPEKAVKWLYHAAPVVALASILTILLYLPVGGLGFTPILSGYGDLILILYVLIIPALALVTGGFASSSPLATIGAQRQMITMISYEFPLAVVVVAVAWKLNHLYTNQAVFSLAFVSSHPLWCKVGLLGLIGMTLLLLSLIIVTPGQLTTVPFDVSEAASEIAEGLTVEYSGRNLALFYLADAAKIVALGALMIALFFPYDISPALGIRGMPAWIADFIFFLLKLLVFSVLTITLPRTAMARLRISQVPIAYWLVTTFVAFGGLACLMIDA